MSDNSKTIMYLDDEPVNLQLVGEVLQHEGYAVKPFKDPLKAITFLQDHSVDLILLDVSMPVMDGCEFYDRLHENPSTSTTPVIFLTGRTVDEDETLCGKKGLNYLPKPLNISALIERTAQMLR